MEDKNRTKELVIDGWIWEDWVYESKRGANPGYGELCVLNILNGSFSLT